MIEISELKKQISKFEKQKELELHKCKNMILKIEYRISKIKKSKPLPRTTNVQEFIFNTIDAMVLKGSFQSVYSYDLEKKLVLEQENKIEKIKKFIKSTERKYDKIIDGLQKSIKALEREEKEDEIKANQERIKLLKNKKALTMEERRFLAQFNSGLDFEGRWKDFFGYPTSPFNIIVFGDAGSGKSHFCVQLSKYLSDNFGKVLYIAAEEGSSTTFDEKLERYNINEDAVLVATATTLEEMKELFDEYDDIDFVFLDSVTHCNIKSEELRDLIIEYNNLSFITITHVNREGKPVGGSGFDHDCQVMVRVKKGIAEWTKNRFTGWETKEFKIFED